MAIEFDDVITRINGALTANRSAALNNQERDAVQRGYGFALGDVIPIQQTENPIMSLDRWLVIASALRTIASEHDMPNLLDSVRDKIDVPKSQLRKVEIMAAR